MLTIYHNPRCSKSREALALVQQFSAEHEQPLQIVEYLSTPLDSAQLSALHQQLGGPLRSMVRDNEAEYASMQLMQADDDALLQALASCPKLLQRPIVSYRGKALIGRPPELLNDFLHHAQGERDAAR